MLQVEPRVEVLMKDLVIYLTQGPKPAHMPDRSEVLHFDIIEGHFEGRSQIQWQQLQPWEAIVQRQQADKGIQRPAHVHSSYMMLSATHDRPVLFALATG